MDSTTIDILARELPGFVAEHPRAFLIAWLIHAGLEFLLPRLKKVKANDAPSLLFNIIKTVLNKAARKRN